MTLRSSLCRRLLTLLVGGAVSLGAQAATQLRVFAGGTNQRPDLMRQLFDEYQKAHPGVTINIETGGATSDAQDKYLNGVLSAKDASLDIFIFDIVHVAKIQAAGWLEPLNGYVGSPDDALAKHLVAYQQTNVIDGKLVAMPAFADAMFLYYRQDLLQRHGVREPRTWDDLAVGAKKIMAAEKAPLQGLSIQGAPIEGAVCTLLLPYWGQGKEITMSAGLPQLDTATAAKGMNTWLEMMDQGVIPREAGETKTGDTVRDFKEGKVIFAINWGFAWERFANDKDSVVGGKVGVMPLPGIRGGRSATCLGGWQWGVSAFSRNKAEAAKLVQFMSTPAAAKFLAREGSLLPALPMSYVDEDVVKRAPWFLGASVAVALSKARPVTPKYSQVSEVLRETTHTILTRKKSPADGMADAMERLKRIPR